MIGAVKPLIIIPRWKAPTWERTGFYLDSLEANGARCLLIDEKKLPDDAGGLVIMGGVDVNPKLYGERRGEKTDQPNNDRDTHELKLLDDALERDLPVLAICRGHQLLNVALGGSLLQNIDDDSHKWIDQGESRWHETALGEPLAEIYGAPKIRVNSRHHQGITEERLAGGLTSIGSAHDGYVEAVRSESHRWVIGVQWHPERPEIRDDSGPLFRAFVEAAANGA
jgi:putative glutamine amidotransferase